MWCWRRMEEITGLTVRKIKKYYTEPRRKDTSYVQEEEGKLTGHISARTAF
jgi:hypothetical protein